MSSNPPTVDTSHAFELELSFKLIIVVIPIPFPIIFIPREPTFSLSSLNVPIPISTITGLSDP